METPPFSKSQQLCRDLEVNEAGTPTITSLPGYPWLMLHDLPQIRQFLNGEFWAQDLETLASHLWVMSTYSNTNINPLHRQRIKGREIIVTEEPRLHLVWYHDRIFIKPLPKYILSHRFWEVFLVNKSSLLGDRRDAIRKAAIGYLRTYRFLIRYESDFAIAKQDHLRLIPEDIQWGEFCSFISALDQIDDVDVSGRYQYGELRLSRLNFYAPFFLGKFYFEQVHGQYSDYFARLYGPVLFIFAIISTALNSIQVELAVDQVSSMPWVSMWFTFRCFATIVLITLALVSLCFSFLWLWIFLDEWVYALRARRRRHGCEPPKF